MTRLETVFAKQRQLSYSPNLEQEWREGKLQVRWYKEYPTLFDENDLSFALCQIPQHFGEWFASIDYFRRGWKVFMEHYVYEKPKNHPLYELRKRKNEVVKQLVGEENFDFLRYLGGKEKRVRPPDLFIFNDKAKFFFAEVKWDSDKIRTIQMELFAQIEIRFNTKIELISVLPQ